MTVIDDVRMATPVLEGVITLLAIDVAMCVAECSPRQHMTRRGRQMLVRARVLPACRR